MVSLLGWGLVFLECKSPLIAFHSRADALEGEGRGICFGLVVFVNLKPGPAAEIQRDILKLSCFSLPALLSLCSQSPLLPSTRHAEAEGHGQDLPLMGICSGESFLGSTLDSTPQHLQGLDTAVWFRRTCSMPFSVACLLV